VDVFTLNTFIFLPILIFISYDKKAICHPQVKELLCNQVVTDFERKPGRNLKEKAFGDISPNLAQLFYYGNGLVA
jgi:hypothetical protein